MCLLQAAQTASPLVVTEEITVGPGDEYTLSAQVCVCVCVCACACAGACACACVRARVCVRVRVRVRIAMRVRVRIHVRAVREPSVPSIDGVRKRTNTPALLVVWCDEVPHQCVCFEGPNGRRTGLR